MKRCATGRHYLPPIGIKAANFSGRPDRCWCEGAA